MYITCVTLIQKQDKKELFQLALNCFSFSHIRNLKRKTKKTKKVAELLMCILSKQPQQEYKVEKFTLYFC